jgi:predicted CopG family antitoxin
MTKKLTITVSDEVYERLHKRIGRRKISRFIDEMAREHFMEKQLDADYAEAAADEAREREAKEWTESGVDEGLPDEDFSGWPDHPTR